MQRLISTVAASFFGVILAACGGDQFAGDPVRIETQSQKSAQQMAAPATVVFTGVRANYTITATTAGYSIVDTTGREATRSVAKGTRLRFADLTVAMDYDGTAGKAYRIYRAAFNRTPDASGLGYWMGQLDGGTQLSAVAQGFVGSQEFKGIYGATPTNLDIVSKFYRNVLRREGEKAGIDYWVGILDKKMATVSQVLEGFSEGAENKAAILPTIQSGVPFLEYGVVYPGPGTGGGGTTASPLSGTWVRLPGPSGDRTDIAIGGIKNEPANRVYMCEKKGSTAAGFYKGTLTGSVVKWDAQHGLPDADFTLSNGQLIVKYKVDYSLPTPYNKGSWSGECGPLENIPPTRMVVMVATTATNIVSITLDGKSIPINRLAAGAPQLDCSTASKSYVLPVPTKKNANGAYYTLLVSSKEAGIDSGGAVKTTVYETTYYQHYFKAGECNKFTVDFLGAVGYTLSPL